MSDATLLQGEEKMKRPIVCIVQARMGSTRLPKKSMLTLGDEPLIVHVLKRAALSKRLDSLVLATTQLPEDDVLESTAKSLGFLVYRGHQSDLVDRYYNAATKFNAETIVRVPADNPLIHPTEIDRIIDYFLRNEVDFASNIGPLWGNGYPDGLGAEVFSMTKLRELHNNLTDPFHREHVTSYFRDNPKQFKLGTVPCPKEFSRPDIVLDVNTLADYKFISKLFSDLGKTTDFINISNIITWYDSQGATITND